MQTERNCKFVFHSPLLACNWRPQLQPDYLTGASWPALAVLIKAGRSGDWRATSGEHARQRCPRAFAVIPFSCGCQKPSCRCSWRNHCQHWRQPNSLAAEVARVESAEFRGKRRTTTTTDAANFFSSPKLADETKINSRPLSTHRLSLVWQLQDSRPIGRRQLALVCWPSCQLGKRVSAADSARRTEQKRAEQNRA